jgi:NAD(P)-dependent dehydrogenase (short-subunit alcohol dehydrogenase family)
VQAGLVDSPDMKPEPEVLEVMVGSLSLKRIADPAEIAAAIVFLTSPAASYITGATLAANGGYMA